MSKNYWHDHDDIEYPTTHSHPIDGHGRSIEHTHDGGETNAVSLHGMRFKRPKAPASDESVSLKPDDVYESSD